MYKLHCTVYCTIHVNNITMKFGMFILSCALCGENISRNVHCCIPHSSPYAGSPCNAHSTIVYKACSILPYFGVHIPKCFCLISALLSPSLAGGRMQMEGRAHMGAANPISPQLYPAIKWSVHSPCVSRCIRLTGPD